jgi:hypothetical protein
MALDSSFLKKLPANNSSTTFGQFLDTLSSESDSSRCELVICPLDFKRATLAIVICRVTASAHIFNWMADNRQGQVIANVFEVCSLLPSLFDK